MKRRRRENDVNVDAEIAQVRRALAAMESVPADVRLMLALRCGTRWTPPGRPIDTILRRGCLQ